MGRTPRIVALKRSRERFRATIRGVRPMGHLCLEHTDGVVREYAFKEVEFVLKARIE